MDAGRAFGAMAMDEERKALEGLSAVLADKPSVGLAKESLVFSRGTVGASAEFQGEQAPKRLSTVFAIPHAPFSLEEVVYRIFHHGGEKSQKEKAGIAPSPENLSQEVIS